VEKLQQNKRKTIGVLVNSVDGFYQSLIWKGIKKGAELNNNNLIIFSGGALKSQLSDEAQHNSIYSMVNTDKLDGLILSSGVMSNFVNFDEFLEFVNQYREIPMVSIGIAIEGISSILFDNKNSMHRLVNHLIEQHKYSRIGFITGPKLSIDALERLHGYEESLEEHNIQIDKNLIIEGDYTINAGSNAIDILIKDKNIKPEVIVAANDEKIGRAHV
jgi:DNA-binding LacI/PurR family transcriptional regulator